MARFSRGSSNGAIAPALSFALASLIALHSSLPGADCNENGSEDSEDIAGGASPDCNANRIPDECDLESPASSFQVLPAFGIESRTASMVLADLDRDGSLDLITAARDSGLVLSMDGRGDGGFEPGRILAAVEGLLAAAPGDIDLDGAPDIVAGSSEGLFVIARDAGGRFSDPAPLESRFGAWLRPVLEDLDGDSLPEILTIDLGGREAFVVWNVGSGAFGSRDTLTLPSGPLHVAALDGDRDGDLDLAVTLASSAIALLENRGARSFVAWRNISLPEAPVWLATPDVDGDGDTDLVAPGNLNIHTLIQDGAGSGIFGTASWRSPSSHTWTWAVGDLNLDGEPDLAALDDGLVSAVEGLGAGEFAIPRRFQVPGEFSEALLAIGDLDGDLDPDLVASTGPFQAVALRNTHGSRDEDCNANGSPDECDFAGRDLDGNGIPDSCDPDCNRNSIPDGADNILDDCDENGVPDECQIEDEDCNRNGIPDSCDLSAYPPYDCDGNGVLDACEVANDFRIDCNGNGLPDACDVAELPSFGAPLSVGLGTQLHSLSAADVDGDGHPDIATVDDRKEVVILYRAGEVGPGRIERIPTPAGAISVLAEDMDADADTDLVVVNDIGGISILFDDGGHPNYVREGTLQGRQPASVNAADFDGDGLADLVAAMADTDEIWIFRNLGRGRFPAPVVKPGGPNTLAVAVSDLDADGDLDIAHGSLDSPSGSVRVLENSGGLFSETQVLPLVGGSFHLEPADLDGDGDSDLLAAGRSLTVIESAPAGLSAAGEILNGRLQPTVAAAEDLDLDGDVDVAVTWSGGADLMTIDWNEGDGALSGRTVVRIPEASLVAALRGQDGAARGLAVLSKWGTVTFVRRSDAGGLDLPIELDLGFTVHDFDAADLDGDGDLDLVAGREHVDTGIAARLHRNDGQGGFSDGGRVLLGGTMEHLLAVDLDGDGDIDLATTNDDVGIARNRGDGTFDAPVSADAGGGAVALAAADLDGDGSIDLAVTRPEARRASVLIHAGGASFQRMQDLPLPEEPERIGAADLDGDGLSEIVVNSSAGYGLPPLAVFRSRGDGTFDAGETYLIAGWMFVLADVDRDADVDVLTTAGVLGNVGDGSLRPEEAHHHANQFEFLVAGDLDGDTDLDMAGLSGFEGRLRVLGGPRPGRSGWEVGFAVGEDGTKAELADVSGDGTPDVLVSFRNSVRMSLLLGRGPESLEPDCNGNEAPDGCDIARGTSVDLDRDGRPDECDGSVFHRGDPNADAATDLSDAVFILGFLFDGTEEPACSESADINNDGVIDIADPVSLLLYLFGPGREPAPPGPASESCGPDPDVPGGPRDLGCLTYGSC